MVDVLDKVFVFKRYLVWLGRQVVLNMWCNYKTCIEKGIEIFGEGMRLFVFIGDQDKFFCEGFIWVD